MRLSFLLLLVASFILVEHTDAKSTEIIPRQHLRSSFGDNKTLRSLKTKVEDEIDDSEDLEEERARMFPTLKQLQNLRKSERLKEIAEALAIAKVEVKKAAAQASTALAKAKEVAAISAQLDDKAELMLTSSTFKNDMFTKWHADGVHPQIVFDALAQPGKYSVRKWKEIAEAYLDFATDMAKAAARNAKV